jgi:hypothetical protein
VSRAMRWGGVCAWAGEFKKSPGTRELPSRGDFLPV